MVIWPSFNRSNQYSTVSGTLLSDAISDEVDDASEGAGHIATEAVIDDKDERGNLASLIDECYTDSVWNLCLVDSHTICCWERL